MKYMAREIEYSIRVKNGKDPYHYLLLISIEDGGIVLFEGKSIPGIAAAMIVHEDDYTSTTITTWKLRLVPGVIEVSMHGRDFESDPLSELSDSLFNGARSWKDAYDFVLNELRKNSGNSATPGPGFAKFVFFMQRKLPEFTKKLNRNYNISNDDLWELAKETNSLAKTQDELKRAFIRARG